MWHTYSDRYGTDSSPYLRDSFWLFFPYAKIARPNWDAKSGQDVLLVDTNSLRQIPIQSSKNCDLQLANIDRQNYSIDAYGPDAIVDRILACRV